MFVICTSLFLDENTGLGLQCTNFGLQAPVVQKVDNAIHRINHYPVDSVVCFVKTYALDSDLSSG